MSTIRLLVPLVCMLVLPTLVRAQAAGVTPDGQQGRLHVVVKGDTLWDITAYYIGTPWIWPSIWKENEDVENPHLIYPADLIWITDKSMRRVSPEEAARLMAESPELPAAPFSPDAPMTPMTEPQEPAEPDPFGALDQGETVVQRVVKYPGVDRFGFVTEEKRAGSGAILGSHEEHYWSSQLQKTIVSLGEGQVHIGDTFTVYRTRRRVLHPDTGRVLGYFTQILGHVEVTEIHPESSFVKVTDAYAEIEPGDRIMPFEEYPKEFVEQQLGHAVKGTIVAQQPYRLYSAWNDLVILDRGSSHGVQPGNRFAIYRAGKEVRDPLTETKILVPDDVIGQVFIVKVTPTSSLALITQAHRKVREGDRFRNL